MRKVLSSLLVLLLVGTLAFSLPVPVQPLIPTQYQGQWQVTGEVFQQDGAIIVEPFDKPIILQVGENTITVTTGDNQPVVRYVDNVSVIGDGYYVLTFKGSKIEWDVIFAEGQYFLAIIDKIEQKIVVFVVERINYTNSANPPATVKESNWENSA
jgi:hypothetical protein